MTDASDQSASDSCARMVGVNHVALEVGDIEAALEFYESLFEFDLRGRGESSAFIDMGDQFIALSEVDETEDDSASRDDHRHFGLVVDDPEKVARRLEDSDAERVSAGSPDFRDPWGNYVQVVAYDEIQFTKIDSVLDGMGLSDLGKTESAIAELAEKGMAPDE